MLGNPDSKPHFFSDKTLEPTIKAIVKKFPLMDTKSLSVSSIFCAYTLPRIHKTLGFNILIWTNFQNSFTGNFFGNLSLYS